MKPKVSILTTTYNHEAYIADAVESMLMQETDFPYELVIGEDCSTDDTRAILFDFKERHPDQIRLLLREENVGRRRNWMETLDACQGDYVAILEGDDYWTDSCKLQRQVDFLDSHPACALCFHPVLKHFEEDDRPDHRFVPRPGKSTYTMRDLLERNFIATCSVMFRNGLVDRFPDWYRTVPAGDWPLHVLNAQHGEIGYIDRVMAVHRVHEGGVWSPHAASRRLQSKIEVLETIGRHLGSDYRDDVEGGLAPMRLRLIRALVGEGRWQEAAAYAARLLADCDASKKAMARALLAAIRP